MKFDNNPYLVQNVDIIVCVGILLKDISPEIMRLLMDEAVLAQDKAYAPYSKFRVGAALLFENGEIVRGCNVENSSYGMTLCAERNAMAAAVSMGLREPIAAAITGVTGEMCTPCGACRQFLSEFNPDMEIILQDGNDLISIRLSELLPLSFSLKKKLASDV